jgi:membrane protease YdiL (CAAX protease family)
MTRGRRLVALAVYAVVSVLIFASDIVPLGQVEDIRLAPMLASLGLLLPLVWWYTKLRKPGAASDNGGAPVAVWLDVFVLFTAAMIIRIPFVQLLGMSFEKTPLIYLLTLTVVFVRQADLGAFGFKTPRLGRSMLTGLIYYLGFAVSMYTTLFVAVYLTTGHLLIVGYDPRPALLVFPFMTFCVGISEEGLFRGYLQTRLSLVYSKKQALWAQAILFGIWHFVWHIAPFDPLGMAVHIASTLAFGLVFGRFFELSGTLVPLILAHGLVDTIDYGAVFSPNLDPMALPIQLSQALSFAVGIISLALLTKRLATKLR